MGNRVHFQNLGLIRYKEAWDYQERLFKEIVDQKITNRDLPADGATHPENYLLFCEHPPVYTLGKSGHMDNVLLSEEELARQGFDFYKINRGGDITYHGPGQNVGYPILDLDQFFTDIHKYMRLLEEVIINTLGEYGIVAGRLKGSTGVWLDPDSPEKARKICAMGVRCSRWVTMHGWAFNVNTNLAHFKNIIPCGIDDKAVTSMAEELGHPVPMDAVTDKIRHHFARQFDVQLLEEQPALGLDT